MPQQEMIKRGMNADLSNSLPISGASCGVRWLDTAVAVGELGLHQFVAALAA
jgi:hypothetical protein